MSLKRTEIKAIFPEATAEQVQLLIDRHSETVEALQQQIEDIKGKAVNAENLQKKLDELTATHTTELETAKKALEDYKTEVCNKETIAKKQDLYRAELKTAKISDAAIEKAVKLADYNAMELDGDRLKDTKTVQDAIASEWGAFIVTTETKGAQTATPPSTTTGVSSVTFAKMGVAERTKLFNQDPNLYNTLKGD